LASGADVICLDVKIGDGAFMKTIEDARELSRIMVSIGESFGKNVTAFITDMDQPLGHAIGNRLEVKEAIETLSGKGPDDLVELCTDIASHMIYYAKQAPTLEAAKALAVEKLNNGEALAKFNEFIIAQGGTLPDLKNFIKVKQIIPFKAKKAGYVLQIKALNIGLTSMKLGGGRETKDDIIDPMVGIILKKKIGEQVQIGDTLAEIYANHNVDSDIFETLEEAFQIVEYPVEKPNIILEVIS